MYKLIASDLDGTLLNSQHQLSALSKQVIHSYQQQGGKFLIATGRHYQDLQRIAGQFNFPMYLISSNGARVHNKQGQVLFKADLEEEQVKQVLAISAEFPVHRNIYQEQAWYIEAQNELITRFSQASQFDYILQDLNTLDHQGVCKFFFIAEHSILTKLELRLSECFGEQLNIAFSMPNCLEVMAKNANKGQALLAVLKEKNIQAQDCLVFGDGMNDKEMFEVAGQAVIMANAHDRLRQTFPDIPQTLSADENGVAHFIQQTMKNRK